MVNIVGTHTTKVNTHFTVASGTFSSEQDLISKIDTFLTVTISGWERIYTISDTGSDRNFVYKCPGSRPNEHDPGYVSFRGDSNFLRINPYSFFDVGTGTGYDNANDGALSNSAPVGGAGGRWWFIGNNDAFYFTTATDGSPTNYYSHGVGFWKTYYDYEYDPKPWFGFAQSTFSSSFESELNRVRSFAPGSFGKSAFWPSSTLSGTADNYEGTQAAVSNNLQSRTGQPHLIPIVFYLSSVTESYRSEIRGEMPGYYQAGLPTSYFTGNIVTVSGTGDISGDYFVERHSAANNYLIGKITRII